MILYWKGYLVTSVYGTFGVTLCFFGLSIFATGSMIKMDGGREVAISGTEARLRGLVIAAIGAFLYGFMFLVRGAGF